MMALSTLEKRAAPHFSVAGINIRVPEVPPNPRTDDVMCGVL